MNGIQCKGPSKLLVNHCVCECMHVWVCRFMDMVMCFTEGVCFRNCEAKVQGWTTNTRMDAGIRKLNRALALNSQRLQQSDINNPRVRANRTDAPQHRHCNQTSVCVHFVMRVTAKEQSQAAVGATLPFVFSTCRPWLTDRWWSAIYCLQRQACILHSKLGRAEPCGKCTLKNTVMHAPVEAPTHRGRPFGHRQHSVLLFHLQWKNLTSDPEHFQLGERGSRGMPCMSASKMRGGIDRYPSFVLFSCLIFSNAKEPLSKNCLLNLEKELRIRIFQTPLGHNELNVSSLRILFSYGLYDPRGSWFISLSLYSSVWFLAATLCNNRPLFFLMSNRS